MLKNLDARCRVDLLYGFFADHSDVVQINEKGGIVETEQFNVTFRTFLDEVFSTPTEK